MCGIAGIWSLSGKACSLEQYKSFLRTLKHRGPDGEGVYFSREHNLFLGHRRLAILDLSDKGQQPMSYNGGTYVLTFNGEIYNFIELRNELIDLGYKFYSDSDSEVILAAYDAWGEECQLKFNGMWAFAIWNSFKGELFLSRDRFGVKPLYYFFDGELFAFASEVKAFLSLPGKRLEVNSVYVANSLYNGNAVEAQSDTLLQGVKRIESGHSLVINCAGSLRKRKWWNTLDHLVAVPDSYEERILGFRELLENACKIRMRSDVSLSTALSGGLDSSSILSLISKIVSNEQINERRPADWNNAFVAVYPGTIQDEQEYAKKIIESTSARSAYVLVSPEEFFPHLEEIIFSFEEVYDLPAGAWLLYKKYQEKNKKISLDGHGADELLGGYSHYVRAEALRRFFHFGGRDKKWLRSTLYEMGAQYPSVIEASKHSIKELLNRHPQLFQTVKSTYRFFKPKSKQWLSEDWEKYPGPTVSSIPGNFDFLNQMLYHDFHFGSLPSILRNFDRCSMSHGVEVRAPFMDWRLVCYAFSLPSTDKIESGWTKRILRDSMQGILREDIRLRKNKKGFASPMVDWFKNAKMQEFVQDTISTRLFQESHIWDAVSIKNDIENAFKIRDFQRAALVWPYLQASILQRQFSLQNQEIMS